MTAHCAPFADRTVYLVLCQYRDALAWAERDVVRTDKKHTIEDIRTGELSHVVQVIELNIGEFSSRDVTDDILEEVKNEAALNWCHEVDLAAERRDQMRDHRRDQLKHEVA